MPRYRLILQFYILQWPALASKKFIVLVRNYYSSIGGRSSLMFQSSPEKEATAFIWHLAKKLSRIFRLAINVQALKTFIRPRCSRSGRAKTHLEKGRNIFLPGISCPSGERFQWVIQNPELPENPHENHLSPEKISPQIGQRIGYPPAPKPAPPKMVAR